MKVIHLNQTGKFASSLKKIYTSRISEARTRTRSARRRAHLETRGLSFPCSQQDESNSGRTRTCSGVLGTSQTFSQQRMYLTGILPTADGYKGAAARDRGSSPHPV